MKREVCLNCNIIKGRFNTPEFCRDGYQHVWREEDFADPIPEPRPDPTPLQAYLITEAVSEFPPADSLFQITIDGTLRAVPTGVKCREGDVLMIVSKEDWKLASDTGLIIFGNHFGGRTVASSYTFDARKKEKPASESGHSDEREEQFMPQ